MIQYLQSEQSQILQAQHENQLLMYHLGRLEMGILSLGEAALHGFLNLSTSWFCVEYCFCLLHRELV